ncbi:MAG: anthranilate synthase component I, partial [Gemmatimonadetes bacterium]
MSPNFGAPPLDGDSSYDQKGFMAHVDRIKEYIRAGDCFQALLSRRIDVPLDFDPAD